MADESRKVTTFAWTVFAFCILSDFNLFAEEARAPVKGLSVEKAAKIAVTGHSIVMQRNVNDWVGDAPEEANTAAVTNGEYIWKDAAGDDTGSGRYTYPLKKELRKGADLKEFRVTYDRDNLYFLITTDRPNDWWTGYKIIGIHRDGAMDGTEVLAQGDPNNRNFDSGTFANLKVAPELACQYVVAIASTYKGRIWDAKGKLIAHREERPDDTPGFKIEDFDWSVIEIAIPLGLIGGKLAGQTWKFIVATGQQDEDIMRKVEVKAGELHGGGGSPNGENPNVYDLAGADNAIQEKELGSYDPNAKEGDPAGFAMVSKSFLIVKFGPE